MNWTHLLVAAGAIFSALSAYALGWRIGRKHGQDEQWVEDVIALGKLDAARRDARGRFRSVVGRN